MAYDVNVPVATQSPTVFPAQSVENFTRLKTLITADHQFNDAIAANDGYHKVSRWVNQGGAIGDDTPAAIASTAQVYTKTLTYRIEGGAGSTRQVVMQQPGDRTVAAEETALGAAPIRAAVSFNTAGVILGAAYNVTSVSYTAASNLYTITFTVAMPLTTYIVVAMKNSGSAQFLAVVNKTTTTFQIQGANNAGSLGLTSGCDLIVLGGWATS